AEYLEDDAEEVVWCNFHEAATTNEKLFRRHTSYNTDRFPRLLKYIADTYDCPTGNRAVEKSDVNGDQQLDVDDLATFSMNFFDQYWKSVDWCTFRERVVAGERFNGRPTRYFLQHYRRMLDFVNDEFDCGGTAPPENALLLENEPKFLLRIAETSGLEGDYYITDPRIGSLFIFDGEMVPKGEIKGLGKPLGVAVDSLGNILVGVDSRDSIEVYDPETGALVTVFGQGEIRMPSAITLDLLGNIYVTDSVHHAVKVFDPDYNFVRTIGKHGIGDGELDFPVDTEVNTLTGEVFVADQGNERVQVFDLEGNWLRSITHRGVCGWWRCTSPPFKKLQALEFDSLGRLHVLDNLVAAVMVFDPSEGTFIGQYGQYGQGEGYLHVPMDIATFGAEVSVVTTGDGDRIEDLIVPLW
ncbi:MAG: 6-bladed beta-propeller, partial [Pseudomonadales bacterium]|nr:6-bladed beta-propeller [Pseudomonadales bacterium]